MRCSDEPAEPAPEIEQVIGRQDPLHTGAIRKNPKSRQLGSGYAAGIAVVIALIIWVAPAFFKTDTTEFEQALISFYQAGDFENALTAAETLKDKGCRCPPGLSDSG